MIGQIESSPEARVKRICFRNALSILFLLKHVLVFDQHVPKKITTWTRTCMSLWGSLYPKNLAVGTFRYKDEITIQPQMLTWMIVSFMSTKKSFKTWMLWCWYYLYNSIFLLWDSAARCFVSHMNTPNIWNLYVHGSLFASCTLHAMSWQRQDALAIAKHQGANAANPPPTGFDIKMRSEEIKQGFHFGMVCLQLMDYNTTFWCVMFQVVMISI